MRCWAVAFVAAFLAVGSARADETTLIFATDGPPDTHMAVRVFHPWSDHVNEIAKGVLKLDVRDGMSIVNPTNFYNRVLEDVVQISWGSIGNLAGTFPLTEFTALPFQAERAEDASVAYWRLYKTGLLDGNFKDVVPIMMSIYTQEVVHLTKPPKSIETLAGLRIMVVSKTASNLISRLGGSPSSIPLPDLYSALQHGTVDGTLIAWTAFQPYRLAEVTTYHYETQLGASPGMVFMARKRYDALPATVRKIIDENSGEAISRQLGKALDELSEEARLKAKAQSGQVDVFATEAQAAKWRELTAPVTAAWVKETPGGEKVLSTFRQILADVKAGK